MTLENSTSPDGNPTETKSSLSLSNEETSPKDSANASDTPLFALLEQFPRGFSTIEEGQAFVKKLQSLRLSPPTLRSALLEESNELEKRLPRRSKPKVNKTQQKVDDILKDIL